MATDNSLNTEDTLENLRLSLEEARGKRDSLQRELIEHESRGNVPGMLDKRFARAVPLAGLCLAAALGVSSVVADFVAFGLPPAIILAVASFLRLKTVTKDNPLREGVKQAILDEEMRISHLEREMQRSFQETDMESGGLDSGIEVFR